jgi:hypothetical protein
MKDAFTCPDCGGYIGKEHTCERPQRPLQWVHNKIAYHKGKFLYHSEQAKFHSRTLTDLARAYSATVHFKEPVQVQETPHFTNRSPSDEEVME